MANIDAGLVRGPQGPQGEKGDPFTYADFTESQIAELQRPATEAAVLADKTTKDAQVAIADVKATEAKLYPVAENILKGNVKDTFVHVEDTFPSSLLGIEIEGATEQVTTTGKNLINGCDSYFIEADSTNKSYLWGYTLESNPLVLNKPLEAGTYTFSFYSLYSTQACTIYFSKKPYVTGQFVNFICNKVVSGDTRFGLNRYYGTFTLTDTYELVGIYSENYQYCFGGMIEKGSNATAYEPYTGGKPSPSPEYPQEIKVIEHPVVKVVGRNLANPSGARYPFLSKEAEQIDDGFIFTITNNADRIINIPCELKKGNKFIVDFDEKQLSGAAQKIKIYFNKLNMYLDKREQRVIPEDVQEIGIYIYDNTVGEYEITNFRVTRNVDDGYKPYTSQSIAFTLPAEHPYLAKLPDGTADEIVVDKDGNVELVARVSKVIPKDTGIVSFGAGTDTDAPYVSFGVSGIASRMGILCNGYQTSKWTNESGYIYCPNGSDIAIRDSRFTSKEKAIELLNDVVVYVAVEPTRYPLGKIEMPKAQDSIMNIWTDAEATPRTGIEYTRDVNIVVANLESSIASITQG